MLNSIFDTKQALNHDFNPNSFVFSLPFFLLRKKKFCFPEEVSSHISDLESGTSFVIPGWVGMG
jgi:hypothetical protein